MVNRTSSKAVRAMAGLHTAFLVCFCLAVGLMVPPPTDILSVIAIGSMFIGIVMFISWFYIRFALIRFDVDRWVSLTTTQKALTCIFIAMSVVGFILRPDFVAGTYILLGVVTGWEVLRDWRKHRNLMRMLDEKQPWQQ